MTAQQPLDFRPKKTQHNVFLIKKERFKFTATLKPMNSFLSNSTVSLTGLSYDMRMKFYVNHKLSLVVRTKNPTQMSKDVASFGIIFKFGKWKK
jgi:hypothetical protein